MTSPLTVPNRPINRLFLRFRFAGRYWRASIGVVLGIGLTGLVALAIASVLYVGVWAGGANTADLSRDKAALATALVRERLRDTLEPVRTQGEYLARTIVASDIDPIDDRRFVELAGGALSPTPQVVALLFIRPQAAGSADTQEIRIYREADGRIASEYVNNKDPDLIATGARSMAMAGAHWADITWIPEIRQPVLSLRVPVRKNGQLKGLLVAVVTVSGLSKSLKAVADDYGLTPFVLVDRTLVLAHPNLATGFGNRDRAHPLPNLDEVGDTVMANIWTGSAYLEEQRSRNLLRGEGHLREIGDQTYVYAYREIDDYGAQWLVGTTQLERTLDAAIDRIIRAVAVGITVLALSLGLTILFGRWMTGKLRELSATAGSVKQFDFAGAPHVSRSRLRELDDTATAFNSMVDGLRWFESYAPRTLVRRLLRAGGDRGVESIQREVTVMFTDIAGFTGLSETMTAAEVAEFLNTHFALVGNAIDAEEGTVDKHLGDGIMAFWGAPEPQDDHTARACRAALAIREAIESENRRRTTQGKPKVMVRIGIHCGAVTVGNIGAASRLSYTIVGDPVNSASRLCELGKQAEPDGRDVVILLGDAAARRVARDFVLIPFGTHVLRGRQADTEVFQLMTAAPAAGVLARRPAAE